MIANTASCKLGCPEWDIGVSVNEDREAEEIDEKDDMDRLNEEADQAAAAAEEDVEDIFKHKYLLNYSTLVVLLKVIHQLVQNVLEILSTVLIETLCNKQKHCVEMEAVKQK